MTDKLAELAKASNKTKAGLDDIESRVKQLRAEGVSWTKIGGALGVSRQAAWRKYAGVINDDSSED